MPTTIFPVCETCGNLSTLPLSSAGLCSPCQAEHDAHHLECRNCGNEYLIEDAREECDFCPSCVENLRTCEDCGDEFFTPRHYHQIGGEDYCEDCAENYRECDACGCSVHEDNAHYAQEGEYCYCSFRCYDRNWSYCSDCETEYANGDSCNCEPEEDESESNGFIQSYSYKPHWRTIGNAEDRKAGIEVECENSLSCSRDEDAKNALSILGQFGACAKDDGSISDDRGFEIVTHPATLESWKAANIEKFCKYLTENGYRAHDTTVCGLHVHVSRADLDIPALARIAIFVHTQRENLEKLGRRKYGRYCNYKEPDATGENLVHDSDRYGAVNFTNRHTVEYRFPRGTLRPATIRATIQLAIAITEFCKSHTTSKRLEVTSGAWDDFEEYVESLPDVYAELITYAAERGV